MRWTTRKRIPSLLRTCGLFSAIALVTSACQGGGQQSLSLDEARGLSTNFSDVSFAPPPRSITDVLTLFEGKNYYKRSCAKERKRGRTESQVDELAKTYPPDSERNFRRTHLYADEALKQFYKGNYPLSIKYMKKSVSEVPAGLDTSRYESQMAVYMAYAGSFDEAETAISRAQSSYSGIKNWRGSEKNRQKVEFHITEGNAALAEARGNLKEAEQIYRKAITLGEAVLGERGQRLGYTRLALAKNLTKQGNVLEAENYVRQVLSSLKTLTPVRVVAMLRFSEILYQQNRFDDAELAATTSVRLFREVCADPENLQWAAAKDLLAKSMLALGKGAKAVAVYDDLRDGMEGDLASFNRIYAGGLERAIAFLRGGRVDDSLKGLQKAYRFAQNRFGENHVETAEAKGFWAMALDAKGEKNKAMTYFKEATKTLATIRGRNEATHSQYRSKLITQAYFKFLIDPANKNIVQNHQINVPSETFVLTGLSSSQIVQQAITSSVARSQISDPDLADLVRREQDTEKQVTALQGSLLEEERQANRRVPRIQFLNSSLSKLKAAHLTLSSEIENRFPDYRTLTNPHPLSINETRKLLLPGETAITYYLGSDFGLVWAFTQNGPVSFSAIKVTSKELSDTVNSLRKALDPTGISSLGDIPDFDVAMAHQLYLKILEPVKASWQNAKSLLVVPQGPLSRLPFSLLPTTPRKPATKSKLLFENYRKVNWLARSHSVTVLPSVASLAALRSSKSAQVKRRPFVGFGDPYFNSRQARAAEKERSGNTTVAQNLARNVPLGLRSKPKTRSVDSADLGLLPRLADTRLEINAIASVMGADPKQDVYLGREANERNVKTKDLSQYEVISFATHGLVSGDLNGLNQPALALSSPIVARDKSNDGLLTMGEILWLKLNADWVVLSACNTAAGEGQGSEAISGLGRAFFYAGARSLLVSNWPVHSGATTELMTNLFKRQAKDHSLSRAESLRSTRIELIDRRISKTSTGKAAFSYAHPIFWAPFTLVGEGG